MTSCILKVLVHENLITSGKFAENFFVYCLKHEKKLMKSSFLQHFSTPFVADLTNLTSILFLYYIIFFSGINQPSE
jgi:hypothetical protein